MAEPGVHDLIEGDSALLIFAPVSLHSINQGNSHNIISQEYQIGIEK
jgi:hypothetical protein